jgi:hypothetical protein
MFVFLHIAGIINNIFFSTSIIGFYNQWRKIRLRKLSSQYGKGQSSKSISYNFIMSSFIALFSFVILRASANPFNHYLVWTRIAALFFIILILIEMIGDRPSYLSFMVLVFTFLFIAIGAFMLYKIIYLYQSYSLYGEMLVLLTTVITFQGFLHQLRMLKRIKGSTALSLSMFQLGLGKDLSSLLLGCAMGMNE